MGEKIVMYSNGKDQSGKRIFFVYHKGKSYTVDECFVLKNPDDFDDDLAALVAESEGIEYTTGHQAVTQFWFRYWKNNNTAPDIRLASQRTSISVEAIYKMFKLNPIIILNKMIGRPSELPPNYKAIPAAHFPIGSQI